MRASLNVRRVSAKLRSGRRIAIPAWVVDSGTPGPTLLLLAAQHGNEVTGSEVVRRFVGAAARSIRTGKVIAVPFANIPALRQRRPHIHMGPEQPYGDARGHNMNATWPGRANGNDTARVTCAIYRAFGRDATHLLDLHCWSRFTAPAVIIRDTPPLRALAARLGARFVQVRPPNPHPIGGHFNATGRIGLTYECAGQYLVEEAQVREGLRVAVNMARAIGVLSGRTVPGYRPVLFSDQSRRTVVAAPCSGLFVARDLKVCGKVRKGRPLGHILSEKTLNCVGIVAPVSGYLAAYGAHRPGCDVALPAQHPYVSRGDVLAIIAQPETH